ncbi:inorganic diphosphatase [Prosthecochloris sp.]|uniref:inorganic diphosphatase n=1 Tax=Prosthecochloris sp. TaxID=290513 RepID=UPI00257FCB7F|nr:inorganic diphosphatase [Prosthecochloris sp.]
MRHRKSALQVCLLFPCIFAVINCGNPKQSGGTAGHLSEPVLKNQYTLAGTKNLYSGYQPIDSKGYIHVVVEIPAGTSQKWEVNKNSGNLELELKDKKPRIVNYLGYPGNYGMVPRTLLPEEKGGDGDPLDVIVLGPAVPRGTVLQARLIGMLKMFDGGEQDDKLIAVMLDSHFADIGSLEELEGRYVGALRILDLWFSNYKGYGVMESGGMADEKEARRVLEKAIDAYSEQEVLAEK